MAAPARCTRPPLAATTQRGLRVLFQHVADGRSDGVHADHRRCPGRKSAGLAITVVAARGRSGARVAASGTRSAQDGSPRATAGSSIASPPAIACVGAQAHSSGSRCQVARVRAGQLMVQDECASENLRPFGIPCVGLEAGA